MAVQEQNRESVEDVYLTIKDVMLHLGLGRDTAYKLVKLKGFPKLIIGKQIRIPKSGYNRWLEENMQTTINL